MHIHTFHIAGTHCPSCKILIEDILIEDSTIHKVFVDLKNQTITIETTSPEHQNILAEKLTTKIIPHGYKILLEKPNTTSTSTIWQALPIGLAALALFFLLQKSGLLNFGIGEQTTATTSFLIGLIASVSSCLAIVGGLVLSLSAKISQDNQSDTKTFILFHAGRLGGFTILGAALGALGQAIGINFTFTAILGLIASTIMIALGLNLIGVIKQNKLTISSNIFQFFRKMENHSITPLFLGFGTFFLPCGFTQAMQIAALSSGSAINGALIMLSFAIGTLPMLTILSFGSAKFAHSKKALLFFQTAGIVVIGFGLFSLLGGLAGLGIIPPLFNI